MRVRPPHVTGGFYHVMLRGNRKQPIFGDDRDRRHLSRLVARSAGRYASEVHAYCWMTNHLHLLVRVGDAPLYRMVHHFATLYARSFNERYGLVGHLFQGRYRCRIVDNDGYFLQLLRYIHRNPVEAGLVDRVEAYPWSSLRSYVGLASTAWLTTRCGLAYFGGDSRRLLSFVQEGDECFEPWHSRTRRTTGRQAADVSAEVAPSTWPDLGSVLSAASDRFGVDLSELEGPDTRRDLTLARSWIGLQAWESGVASLAAVARRLNRSTAALSRSIQRNAARLERLKANARHLPGKVEG